MAVIATSASCQDVDLGNLENIGFRIDGSEVRGDLGHSVSGAGDVNGDGFADVIVGAPAVDFWRGESYVLFGKNDSAAVDLGNLGDSGFKILGAHFGGSSGTHVSGAGDINGDGLADVIVGDCCSANAEPDLQVVFGKSDSADVDLGNLGNGGFEIFASHILEAEISVSGAGDVNGDGLADLIVSSFSPDWITFIGPPPPPTGETYVIFGKTDSYPVHANDLGDRGFLIDTTGSNDLAVSSVSGAGDVNGDGLADLVLGVPRFGSLQPGRSFVVFGKPDSVAVDLNNLGNGGFRINGVNNSDSFGQMSSAAGDVNGDGLADLIIATYHSSHVIFGKADSAEVNTSNLGDFGFHIDRGSRVSGAGDVNGDGLSDLIIGVPWDDDITEFAGESYVVFGKIDSAGVNLANLGASGFRMSGIDTWDSAGSSVSGAGDVNGDGLADVVIGAPYANRDLFFLYGAGESYVVFSQQQPQPAATYKASVLQNNPPRVAIGTTGDGSNASHPDSRAWVDFIDGEVDSGLASTVSATKIHGNGSFLIPAADISWLLETDRQHWTTVEIRFRYLESELLIDDEHRLGLFFSPDGNAPFIAIPSVVNPTSNTISAVIEELGFFYIGRAPGFPAARPVPATSIGALIALAISISLIAISYLGQSMLPGSGYISRTRIGD